MYIEGLKFASGSDLLQVMRSRAVLFLFSCVIDVSGAEPEVLMRFLCISSIVSKETRASKSNYQLYPQSCRIKIHRTRLEVYGSSDAEHVHTALAS
ncbi:hypothetical protein BJ742DRAFT_826201 [Cladochytrium replicatum]|nr:hypothetical protein BJ742DRAFT_826201 [Cladochytrium replicatum]